MRVAQAVLKLYLYHIFILICILVTMGYIWNIIDFLPGLYSWITAIVYGCTIYSVAWNYGKKDGRKIPGSFPQPLFPVKVSVIASVLPVCLLLVRFISPDIIHSNVPLINGEKDFFLNGNRLQGVMDFIFKLWYFPLGNLIGNGNFLLYLLAVLLLPILFISGYFVGLKRFKLLDVISKKLIFVSEKEK